MAGLMPTKSTRRIRRMFDRISPTYDLLNRLFSLGADQRWRQRAAAEVPPNARVLDLCCGTGDLALAIRAPCTVGIDLSAEMLRRARRKSSRVKYSQGSALYLPFGNESFDACTVGFGIRNLSDPAAGFREVFRVLVPGGRFILLEFSLPSAGPLRWAFRGYMAGFMAAAGNAVSRSRAYTYFAGSVEDWFPPNRVLSLLEAAGFVPVSEDSLSWGIAHLFVVRKPTRADRPARGHNLLL